jgi:ABC-type transport system involved in multi-copper enzyme maturation permease subunit
VNRALSAELVKVRTTRMWWGLLIGLAVLVAIQVAFSASFAGRDTGAGGPVLPSLDTAAGLRTAMSAGYQYGYLMALVLGAIVGSVDFRHRTATQTFLAAPRRGRVIVAKCLACASIGLVYAVVTQLLSLVLVLVVAAVRGLDVDLGGEGVLRSLLLGVPGIALWCVVGVSLGMLLRNQVAAVLVAVGYVLLIDPLAALAIRQLNASPVDEYLLGSASSALVGSSPGVELLPWWAGGLVMLGYAVVIALAGWWVTVRRDVG